MTRNHFLKLGVSSVAAAVLPACGSDPKATPGEESSSSSGEPSTSLTSSMTASPSTTDPSSTSDPDSTGPTTADSGSGDDSSTGHGSSGSSSDSGSTSGSGESSSGESSSGESSGSESSSSDDDASTGEPAECTDDATSAFSGHPHNLDIPLADVLAGVMQMYVADGGGHTHAVTLSAGDFATLSSTGSVIVGSGTADGMPGGHTHTVTINCT
ncbi:MAG: hypothetical protein IAG13_08920 [Deltaproteobacteria bacterium]|nr:hypothetical protein [Nannocystaceae bacterium]